jgi:ribonucleoside-diphosphate reductase alpha chain
MGMMGLATHMARNKLKYSSIAGKQEIHWLAERHMYMAIEASLMISKERGLAPWIHKTKWPEGWSPLDTYNRNVDSIGEFSLTYDWAGQKQRVIENGGIAHSCLVNFMPGESSSKAAGLTNSIYPIRRKILKKTDEQNSIRWAAPFGDDPDYEYEMAWDIPTKDMIDCYALFQKFTDQAISADLFRRIIKDEKITSTEMIRDYLYMVKMGLKTRYYQNCETAEGLDLEHMETAVANNTSEANCASGACAL